MLADGKLNKTISVIIVTYNAEEFIADCLLSVKEQSYRDFEVIVVDNASKDRTTDIIGQYFTWVKLIKSQQNLGFAGGNNLGYKYAKGKYIALLNPDAKAHRDWLINLVTALETDDNCGICASLMLKWGTKIVDTAGDGCTRAGKGFKIGHNQPAELHQISKEVFAACGGAVLYKRTMIEKIGFFDEDFYLLHEDTDLSFRARIFGWTCKYVPTAVVEHRISASIGYKTSLAVYHSVKNSDMVWLKNTPGLLIIATLPEKILSDIASFIYLGLIHKKYKEYIAAKYFTVINIFKIIGKRKYIHAKQNENYRTTYKLLTPFLSIGHLRKLWKEKMLEIISVLRPGGGSNKSKDISNNSNS